MWIVYRWHASRQSSVAMTVCAVTCARTFCTRWSLSRLVDKCRTYSIQLQYFLQLTRRKSLMLEVSAAVGCALVLWFDSDTGVRCQRHVFRNTMSNPASQRAAWPCPWTGCEYQGRQYRVTGSLWRVPQKTASVFAGFSSKAFSVNHRETSRAQSSMFDNLICMICLESESATCTAVGRQRILLITDCAAL